MIKTNKFLIFLVFVFLFFIINTNTTKAATTTIMSIQDLYNVRDNLSGNYELGVDLDFDDPNSYDTTTSTTGYDTVEEFRTAMTSGTGWLPIDLFAGTFDGSSFIISNLFINRPTTTNIGLFGNTNVGSSLMNVALDSVNITGKTKVGGLVGNADGSIAGSYISGNVVGATGGYSTGGLVGQNNSSISNSYSTASVSGEYSVGGLVGSAGGNITNSYSTGSVVNYVAGMTGGLVGYNLANITNSYSTGVVNGIGTDTVGGLVGEHDEGTISNSYSIGSVIGGTNVGGLVGWVWTSNGALITNSYYNSQTSGQSDNDGRGTPRTTLEMTYPYNTEATTTYVGWDFDTIWYHDTTGVVNNGYPFNYAAPDTTAPVISGLSNDATPAKTKTWSWSSDDESATYRYAVNQTATHAFTDEVYSATTSTTQSSGNGTYYFHVQAKDTANNTSTTTVSAILDNTGPVITILGSNPASVYVGDSYSDSGATALDAVDGNRTSSIVATNTVNTSVVGSYTVTYNVSDTASNPATSAVRTVNVISRPGGGMPIYMLNSMNQQNQANQNNNTEPSNTISDTTSWTTGRWVKTSDSPVVYFLDTNNVRHAYSNEGIWKSYFNNDFSFVSTISKEELANYQLDRNVPFNINTLFKIPSIPKVYRVGNNRSISWIKTEELANKLYGNNWNKLVKDLSDSLFGDYILEEDTDNDGLNDSDEEIYQTDKNNNDTDGDTYLDGEEVIHKYDPLQAANDKL